MPQAGELCLGEYGLTVDVPTAHGHERHAADAGIRTKRWIHLLQSEHVLDVPQLEPAGVGPAVEVEIASRPYEVLDVEHQREWLVELPAADLHVMPIA